MKKPTAILLLAILAFNWVGYRFVSIFLERAADTALTSKIDNKQYDESNLMEIRVPLNAPYLSGSPAAFERYDGEMELDGVHYKYVKRKIVNGELVLLCLPNESKNRIQRSSVGFFKLVNDLNQSSHGKEKNSAPFKSFVTEYKQENNSWSITPLNFITLRHAAAHPASPVCGYSAVIKQPPRA